MENGSAVGFDGSWKRRLVGSEAYATGLEIKLLREKVGKQIAREQADLNDGQPFVPINESWACKALADSVASLDPGQSDEQFVAQLSTIAERFDHFHQPEK